MDQNRIDRWRYVMSKKWLYTFILVPCLLLIAGIVTAAPMPLWQLHVGDWSEFAKHDSIGATWTVTANVVGTQTFNGKEYFHVRETNYDNDGKISDMYLRSEGNMGYMYNGSGEDLFAQVAPVGTSWNYPIDGGTGTRYLTIAAIEPVTVPYGTFLTAYVVEAYEVFGGYTSPSVYNYFVPGFGMVKEVDYWAVNAPTTSGLSALHRTNVLIWRNPITGENVVYYMDGITILGGAYLPTIDPAWTLSGTADLNSDGNPDLLWRNPVTGENVVYYMNGVTILGGVYLPTIDPAWTLSGTADLNADGKPDLLWRNPVTGENVVYYMDGVTILSGVYLPTIDPAWTLCGTADLNSDGKPDFLWRNPVTGENVVYYMNGVTILSGVYLPTIDPAWTLAGAMDMNADGKPDFLWRNPVTGENVVYYMNGVNILSGAYLPTIDPAWILAGHY
jgi:hypothetical protein